MINKDQEELIKSTKMAYKVKEKKVDPKTIEPLGYCEKKPSYYEIVVKDNLNQDIEDTVRIHEHGHIYLGHMDIDNSQAMEEIQETYNKIHNSKNKILTLSTRHRVLNICMDIEINSQYLSIDQLKGMYGFAYRLCTARSYDAEPGLRYYEYYEPVLKNEKVIEMATSGKYSKEGVDSAFSTDGNSDDSAQRSSTGNSSNTDGSDGPIDADTISDVKPGNKSGKISKAQSQDYSSSGSGVVGYTEVSKDDYQAIDGFFKKLLKWSTKILSDKFKQQLRGSRTNKSIFYNSLKYKIGKKKQKVAIIVDVSGSRSTESLGKLLNSIYKYRDSISDESVIYYWDTKLIKEIKLSEFLDDMEIPRGGGTDMTSAIKHAQKLEFNTILLFSDFYDDIDRIHSSTIDSPIKYYGAIVDSDDSQISRVLKTLINFKEFLILKD